MGRAGNPSKRSTWGLDGESDFAYRLDCVTFTPFGESCQLGWGHYRGPHLAS